MFVAERILELDTPSRKVKSKDLKDQFSSRCMTSVAVQHENFGPIGGRGMTMNHALKCGSRFFPSIAQRQRVSFRVIRKLELKGKGPECVWMVDIVEDKCSRALAKSSPFLLCPISHTTKVFVEAKEHNVRIRLRIGLLSVIVK